MPLPRNAGYGQVGDVIAAVLSKLDRTNELLEILIENQEQEPDFDQTYVVGGNIAANTVIPIQVPRSLHHVEVTLSSSLTAAVLDGNVQAAEAQQKHNVAAAGPSNAILTTSGSSVTARDYLGETGYLTVFFPSAGTGWVNVRIRALDRLQERAERT